MNSKKIFVNTLTFLRVPIIIGWLVLAIVFELHGKPAYMWWVAVVLLGLSGLTDAFDGALARRWNVVSSLGKMADPLMDKVFYVITFPALCWIIAHQGNHVHAVVMLIFTILYIVRDLWVTFLRAVGTMFGANVAARFIGKLRTALSFPAAGIIYICVALNRTGIQPEVAAGLLILCYIVEGALILLNTVSFFTYTAAYAPYLKKALEKK